MRPPFAVDEGTKRSSFRPDDGEFTVVHLQAQSLNYLFSSKVLAADARDC